MNLNEESVLGERERNIKRGSNVRGFMENLLLGNREREIQVKPSVVGAPDVNVPVTSKN